MRPDVIEFLYSNEDYIKFIREQPMWYRKLMRNPSDTESFELAALQFYKKTLPDKIEKFHNSLSMASFMMDMFQGYNS